MNAKELIGKRAIRTASTVKGDMSYTSEPVLILNATDRHIIYKTKIFRNAIVTTMNYLFCDDNWVDYDEMEEKAMETLKEYESIMQDIETAKQEMEDKK